MAKENAMARNKFRADVLEVRDELNKAEYALNVRRYDLAIEVLQKMLKEHPENSAIFYTLARAYFAKQELMQANQAIREALRLDPQSSMSHTLYGNILSNIGMIDAADAEYRMSLELEPQSAYTHYMYAALLVDKRKDLVGAREHAGKALELDPAEALHHMVMAKILGVAGEFAEAEVEFSRALSLDPENVHVRRVYGWYLLYKRNRPEQAFEQLKAAMQLNPEDPAVRKVFIAAFIARKKRYRLFWYFAFFMSNKSWLVRGIILFVLLMTPVLASHAMNSLNPIVQVMATLCYLLVLCCSVYLIVCSLVLNLMIKRGHLK
jgi:Tfp pilus assembly protein PilF